MDSLLIKNGRVIDPRNKIDDKLDVYIKDGKIKEVGKQLDIPGRPRSSSKSEKVKKILDADGLIVVPGFIDLHSHLREPGREDAETIQSGTRAAAAGGFTTVCAMPNTNPVIDSQTGIKFILDRARSTGVVNVLPIAAITRGSLGEEINEFGDLLSHGAVAFSDDGRPVMNAEIMRRALEYTSMFNVTIMNHCEDLNLSADGIMNEGHTSTLLGLKGIPAAAESVMVARDLELAEFTGGWIHICHVSNKRSVELIREAKKRGVKVTAEVTPHHLILTEEIVKTSEFNTHTKVKPPLATAADKEALLQALIDDTIAVIATDHAPHTNIEKDKVYNEAPFGLIGLETAWAVLFADLVANNKLTINKLIEKLSPVPATIINLKDKGHLSPGASADIALINPQKKWRIDPTQFFSKSQNTPFSGKSVVGKVETTIVNGKIVYHRGEILP